MVYFALVRIRVVTRTLRMGADGGTIPRRDELVKEKKKPEKVVLSLNSSMQFTFYVLVLHFLCITQHIVTIIVLNYLCNLPKNY